MSSFPLKVRKKQGNLKQVFNLFQEMLFNSHRNLSTKNDVASVNLIFFKKKMLIKFCRFSENILSLHHHLK